MTDSFKQIDSEQLAALWVQSHSKLAGYIASLVQDLNQVDDILQNVAMIVVRKRLEYDPGQSFLSWTIQIARLEVLRHRRNLARDRHCFDEKLIDQLTNTYEQNAHAMEPMREALAYCVQQLRGRARKALIMRHLEDLKPPEIAQSLGITPDAVRSLMYRARRLLQQCIERRVQVKEVAK